jgi:ZIP family zinc transporter
MNALQLSLATLLATYVGGLCALRLHGRLQLLLGFTAVAVLGVVVFDLLPEILALSRERGGDPTAALAALACGVVAFHGLKRLARARQPARAGWLSAAALIGHSFMDGIGIGIAFQVSQPVGVAVAGAVIAHDFCDGVNTVSVMLAHRNPSRLALRMLALDAVAPLLGVLVTFAFDAGAVDLAPGLAFFAGFLVYVGASNARLAFTMNT